MKSVYTLLVLSLLGATSALANVDPTPTPTPTPTVTPSAPIATKNEIGAQVNVIRDTVEDALRKMDGRKIENSFKMADYWAQLPGFKRTVSSALDEFRRSIGNESTGLLGEAALLLDRYNSIDLSNSFTAEQKKILLEGALKNIQEQVPVLQGRYNQIVKTVFDRILGSIPYSMTPTDYAYMGGGDRDQREIARKTLKDAGCKSVVNRKRWKSGEQNAYARLTLKNIAGEVIAERTVCSFRAEDGKHYASFDDGTVIDPAVELAAQIYPKYFYPLVAKGRKSELCVGMRSGDLVFALGLVNESINRPIQLLVASKLQGIRMEAVNSIHMARDFVIQSLSSTKYPVKLPYDTQ